MVSNFNAVASDPKLAVGRSANRLSSKNINLHNEIISHEDIISSPISPSAIVEPTTELKEIKKGGKITKPSGYSSPISTTQRQRRDSDAASVSSSRSVKTRSSIGTVVSKQSTLSHSSKAASTSRLYVKTPHSGPSQLNKRFDSSASSVGSSVKAAVKSSNAIAQAKKTASPGSGYGQGSSSSPVPAVSRNRAALSPASFTSPVAPSPRSRPQSLGGTASKAFSPVPSSTTPRATTAFSADKKSPASDFSIKRSKSSDGLPRGSSVKDAKSSAVISTTKSLDGKSDAKPVRSPAVTPTATIQRTKSLDKVQIIRRNNSSDSISTCHSAPATKAATPKRAPYTGSLYDTKPKKTTPLAEVVTIGATTRSSLSLNSSSCDSKHSQRDSKKPGASSLTARILAADDLQRARSCELSSTPRKGSLAVEKEEAAAISVRLTSVDAVAVASAPLQEQSAPPLSVITVEDNLVPPQEKRRAKDVPASIVNSYEVGSANPMLKAPPKMMIATRERSDSRDSIVSSASNPASSFLSIYSPASGSNLLQVKITKAPPVVHSVSAAASAPANTLTHRRDASLDHSAIGEEYHRRAMMEAAAASSSSSVRSAMRRASTSSPPSLDAMLSLPPPPKPRPDAAVLVSPLPKKSTTDTPQYMPPLTQASHEMITKMFQSIDASSKAGKSATGAENCSSENESSQTNVVPKYALDIRPSDENALLKML